VLDADHDRGADSLDKCPARRSAPRSTCVRLPGCSPRRLTPISTGCQNNLDQCPGHAARHHDRRVRCPVQSSPVAHRSRRVPDSLDQCPGTPRGLRWTSPAARFSPRRPEVRRLRELRSAGGTASIDGQVTRMRRRRTPVLGLLFQVTGPVTATAVTDTYGNYWFPGLPAGTRTRFCRQCRPAGTRPFRRAGRPARAARLDDHPQ